MPSSAARRSPSPGRIQRFDRLRARLLPPVSGSRKLLRKFSGGSVDNRPPLPCGGIDDTYLGGALPEDPFAPGPMSIIYRKSPSAAATRGRSRGRRSPHPEPCPPAPPACPASGTDFPTTRGLGGQGDMRVDFPSLECCGEASSKCSSRASGATFHTGLTSASDTLNEEEGEGEAEGEEGGQILYMPPDYEYTPFEEWPPSATAVLGPPKCAFPPSQQDHPHVVDIDTPRRGHVPAPIAISTDLCATTFAHKAAGELSPLSIPAASVAYYRRHVSSSSLPSSLARKARNHTRPCPIQRTPTNARTPGID
ncbi:hypothetical protein JB92DRAFT_972251 [Gautieria morchelliformis]|nr:hypothetical protein JB92DRAFT_972251 [Gautieria morchelliformis]